MSWFYIILKVNFVYSRVSRQYREVKQSGSSIANSIYPYIHAIRHGSDSSPASTTTLHTPQLQLLLSLYHTWSWIPVPNDSSMSSLPVV